MAAGGRSGDIKVGALVEGEGQLIAYSKNYKRIYCTKMAAISEK